MSKLKRNDNGKVMIRYGLQVTGYRLQVTVERLQVRLYLLVPSTGIAAVGKT